MTVNRIRNIVCKLPGEQPAEDRESRIVNANMKRFALKLQAQQAGEPMGSAEGMDTQADGAQSGLNHKTN